MLTIPAPFDAHVHFRQDALLPNFVGQHDRVFEYAVAMPNTTPAILTAEAADTYKEQISSHCKRMKPLMTLKLTPEMNLDVQVLRDHI